MKARRAPERVHVVHPPSDDIRRSHPDNNEIIRMLAKVGDKLKRSEAERVELLKELREYRKSLNELEDKSDQAEKVYLSLEHKLKNRDKIENELSQRQARFEKTLKDAEEKLVKTAAGQAVLDKRIEETQAGQTVLTERLDEAVTQQARLDRQIENASQDKSRMMRKVERLEEVIIQTQDTLNAKAMVLLTDQSTAAQNGSPQLPASLRDDTHLHMSGLDNEAPWWQRVMPMQATGTAMMVILAVLTGAMIVKLQQPEVPQVAVLEGGEIVRLNTDDSSWEPVLKNGDVVPSTRLAELNDLEDQKLSTRLTEDTQQNGAEFTDRTEALANGLILDDITAEPSASEESTQIQSALNETESNPVDYSNDSQLLAALEENPDQVAANLNAIEPAAHTSEKNAPISAVSSIENFDGVAFQHNPEIEKQIIAEQDNRTLGERVTRDESLPDVVRKIEQEAFNGVSEAQHDLAAIYTAGHGGVEQNFQNAAFWFREAANGGVGNAAYNLGVLHHQGLGVDRDLDRALYWYREAAKDNHPEAQYNLGIAHIEGIGTDYNAGLAAAFFERSANNGIMEAAYNLGLIYENGLLGEPKPDDALLWYSIASDQGSPDAKTAMEELAKSLQIGTEDVEKLVERMQAINEATLGRRAGPLKEASSGKKPHQNRTASLNREQVLVAQIQEQLMTLGLYTGPADGISGPKTVNAIRSYQQDNSLSQTGRASEELLVHMLATELQEQGSSEN